MSAMGSLEADGQDLEPLVDAGYDETRLASSQNHPAENHVLRASWPQEGGDVDAGTYMSIQHERHHGSLSQGRGVAPSCLVIHRVSCDRRRVDGEDHQDHPRSADYLDVPRLFTNDTRGSALRGQQPLSDFEEYSENNPGICMIVYRVYSCIAYHHKFKASFEILTTGIDRQAFNRLRPWFFKLQRTGPPAKVASENIVFTSKTLPAAMNAVVSSGHLRLADWNAERHLQAPYDYFYHFRRLLRQQSASILGIAERKELEVLLDYIDKTQGANFDEVDAIFASGKVHLNNLTKLFRPNELIVTSQDGYPRAYITERSPTFDGRALLLECWTWVFDGSFRQKTEVISVSWPALGSAVVPITSLVAWPLRLDKSDLQQRLEKRGRDFWTCRHRRFVSYEAPIQTIFELKVVWNSCSPCDKLRISCWL